MQTPEGVPRLFDLVKVHDERMKLAFFASLGNTIVAKDLDQVGFHGDVYLMVLCSVHMFITSSYFIVLEAY